METFFLFDLPLGIILFPMVSLLIFVVDIALDLWAVVCLYEDQKYFTMGLLIFLLLSSSVLLQIFSWLWYSDPSKHQESKIETFVSKHNLMAPVHIFQLGVFLRFAALMEISIRRFKQNVRKENQNHDLSMLRLFEAFSEKAPQIVLMTSLIMETLEMEPFTVTKLFVAFSSLSFTMLSYHRKMRIHVPEKLKMGWTSSIIYFLWNLFLIGTRVVCVTLFASVLPCLIAAHFLSLWTLLVIWAWWLKTDFMDTKAGEWLYRATVGLIWYFSWFNVTSGNTKLRGNIYHVVMGADTMLLLGLWWWKRSVESARLSPSPINPYILIGLLMITYVLGVLLKLVYYWKFHPKHPELQIQADVKDTKPEIKPMTLLESGEVCNTVDGTLRKTTEHTAANEPEPDHSGSPQTQTGANKRITCMVMNFYY